VIFTSGATECNNIAVKGVARFYKSKKDHIVTTQTVRNLYNKFCFFLNYESIIGCLYLGTQVCVGFM